MPVRYCPKCGEPHCDECHELSDRNTGREAVYVIIAFCISWIVAVYFING